MLARRTLFAVAALLALAACGGQKASDPNTLLIGATPVPHAEILEFIKPELAKQGLTLDIVVFNDYVQPNLQVDQGAINVNYFQIRPYLDDFNAQRGTRLVAMGGVHLEPFAGYSSKWKSLAALPSGATVAMPNDASSEGRSLLLLQKGGLITLRDPNSRTPSVNDVVKNPKNLQFRTLEAATVPRTFGEVDLAMINTNYALDAKLNPVKDSLIIEDKGSAFANLIVGKPGIEKDPRVAKLLAALHSPAVRAFITEKYKGAVLPAF